MPILIESAVEEGELLSCPVIVCDVCGRPITHPSEGAYVWRFVSEQRTPCFFVHKYPRNCFDVFERRLGETVGWNELAYFPMFLMRNIGFTVTATPSLGIPERLTARILPPTG